MPSLPILTENRERVWPIRTLAFTLIFGTMLLRLFYLVYNCPLDLAPDEAHYWHWSNRLDWSYYSKGPLVAFLIRASCWLFGGWSEQWTGSQMAAVRLPAVLCGALLLTSLYVLVILFMRREKWALLAVALALTLPIVAAGSLLMTIDAPYTCCWGWALVFAYRALFHASPWSWCWAGACIALGILAKYTMILFVPMIGLLLLATPALRVQLRRPGFWVMVLVGALGGAPILIWNMQNDWLTVKHMLGSHAGMQGDNATRIHWLGPLNYLGMQCALFMVYWWIVWIWAMAAHNPFGEKRPEYRFLWFMSVPMVAFFLLFSLKNGGGEPNWPITGYISGMVLAGAWMSKQLKSPCAWWRRIPKILVPALAILGLLLTVLIHEPRWLQPALVHLVPAATKENPTPLRQVDATCRLRGWHALAAEVDRVRKRLRAEGIEPILVGASWSLPGEISFYCQGHPEVFSVGLAIGDRHSQYDLWRPNPVLEPDAFIGKTFILVDADKDRVKMAFNRFDDTYNFVYQEDGVAVASWSITVCRGFRGFPLQKTQNRANY
jgi:Dolichyl-phosphate-mannose-protein mannosyltransferase